MKAVVQRITSASVTVDGRIQGEVGEGLLVLLGVKPEDTEKEAEYLGRQAVQSPDLYRPGGQDESLSAQHRRRDAGCLQLHLIRGLQKGQSPSFTGAAVRRRRSPCTTILWSVSADRVSPRWRRVYSARIWRFGLSTTAQLLLCWTPTKSCPERGCKKGCSVCLAAVRETAGRTCRAVQKEGRISDET